jgi:hypothetical protein
MSLGVIARSTCDEAIQRAASPPSRGIRDRGVSADGQRLRAAWMASSQELLAMTVKIGRDVSDLCRVLKEDLSRVCLIY